MSTDHMSIKLKFIGVTPFLMHSDRMSDPLDPTTIEFKKISSKKTKTESDHIEMSKMEWCGGIYHDRKIGPYIPGKMIRAALIAGAKKNKNGPKMKGGVIVASMKLPLQYDGPRDLEKLWDSGNFKFRTPVSVQGKKVMRTRPMFSEGWAVDVELIYDPNEIDKEEILIAAEKAGQLCGIGDYRIGGGGDFGRFDVCEIQ